jgi:putative ABC transport system ATP-binding protein
MSEKNKYLYEVENLNFSYETKGGQLVPALRGVNINIESGKFLCFVGPSGSGKTTLLNILGLIEEIQEGKVLFGYKNFSTLSEKEKCYIRKYEIGFVFQNFHLFPVLTAKENVEFFLSKQKLTASEREERVGNALKMVGIWDQRNQRPLEMSGGQCQRVAIARALAKNPSIILADEPTASLDQKTGSEIMEILLKINNTDKTTIILVSHDPMVHRFSKNIYTMKDGAICK